MEWLRELAYRVARAWTIAELSVLEWITGPEPETPEDRAIREEGERIRKRFPNRRSQFR